MNHKERRPTRGEWGKCAIDKVTSQPRERLTLILHRATTARTLFYLGLDGTSLFHLNKAERVLSSTCRYIEF